MGCLALHLSLIFPKLPLNHIHTNCTPKHGMYFLKVGSTRNGALWISVAWMSNNLILFWKWFTNHTNCLFDFLYYRYYANQKKTLEVNPRHPLVKELLKRVETDKEDKTAKDLARVLFETATLRSGYLIKVSLTSWLFLIGNLLRVSCLDRTGALLLNSDATW